MELKYFNCPFNIKQEDITEQGIFIGYGSTFGGKPDSYGDIIVKGAFTETLKKGGRNGTGIAMLWQHNSDEPIGVYKEVIEDQKGLRVIGQLALDVQRGKEAYHLMKMGALNGLSIGWDFLRDDNGDKLDSSFEIIEKNKQRIRYLKQLELWEISPVTFMANTNATITGVKGVYESAKTLREFEEGLRELGLSKDASCYIASKCKFGLEQEWNKDSYEILNAIKQIRKQIGGR
jgi:uncharacterized protein